MKQNIVFCGPPGIGKTHISHAIGHEVFWRGDDAVFFTTHKLLIKLLDTSYPKRVERLCKQYITSRLLILDDFGFRRYNSKELGLLYELSDERLGRESTIITSNHPV
jgi:DNA replication protein DnaC